MSMTPPGTATSPARAEADASTRPNTAAITGGTRTRISNRPVWTAPPRRGAVASIEPELPGPRDLAASALFPRHERALAFPQVHLARPRDLLLVILQQLLPLREPARRARDREEDRKGRRGNSDRLVDQAGVEVHVRIQPALDEVFVLESDALELEGDVQER